MIWMVWLLAILLGLVLLGVLFTAFTAWRVEAALPPQGDWVQVKQAKLHVVERGQGPVILCIHGLGGNLHHFTYGVMAPLAEYYRVIAVDRPGCGYSKVTGGVDLTVQAQADAMAELLRHLGVERALVVGHSLGGAVALALAQQHPQLVAGLALLAPLTQLPSTVSPAFKALSDTPKSMRGIMAWTLATPASMLRGAALLKLIFAPEAAPADFATKGGGWLGLRPRHFVTACADVGMLPGSMPQVEAGYSAMKLPVQVLYGRQDQILSAQTNGVDLSQRLPGAQVVLMDAGHMLPITQVPLTVQFIQNVAKASGLV